MPNTSPDLSQTLQNLTGNFPGATPGGAALPPQSIDSRIQALLKAPLAQGDKLARITDILNELENLTIGGAPNTTSRKLAVVGSTRNISTFEIPTVNGFQGSFYLNLSEAVATLQGVLITPSAGVAINTLIATLPVSLNTLFISVTNPNNGFKTNDQIYVSGTSVYASNLTAGQYIQVAALAQRLT